MLFLQARQVNRRSTLGTRTGGGEGGESHSWSPKVLPRFGIRCRKFHFQLEAVKLVPATFCSGSRYAFPLIFFFHFFSPPPPRPPHLFRSPDKIMRRCRRYRDFLLPHPHNKRLADSPVCVIRSSCNLPPHF